MENHMNDFFSDAILYKQINSRPLDLFVSRFSVQCGNDHSARVFRTSEITYLATLTPRDVVQESYSNLVQMIEPEIGCVYEGCEQYPLVHEVECHFDLGYDVVYIFNNEEEKFDHD